MGKLTPEVTEEMQDAGVDAYLNSPGITLEGDLAAAYLAMRAKDPSSGGDQLTTLADVLEEAVGVPLVKR